MALDKQGILNELGSVMNKLQSADCGCMGKLFSNQSGGLGGASCNPQPGGGCGFGGFGGCRGGCCHGRGGFNCGHAGGEPCIGNCNPRKMYADTYSYLNTNLMQPTVNEVYNDLKSITPENTVLNNNSMATKMGLSPQGNMQGSHPMQGGNPMQKGNSMQGGNAMYRGNAMQGGCSMEEGNVQDGTPMQHSQMMSTPIDNQMQGNFDNDMTNQRVQQMMGGMGPNIAKMMQCGGNARPMNSSPQSDQMPGQMLIDAPQSPHGKVGVTPINAAGAMYNAEGGILNNPNQQLFTPTTQYVTGADITRSGFNQGQAHSNMQHGIISPNMQQGMENPNIQRAEPNPNMQQSMTNPNPGQTRHFSGGQQMTPSNRNYGQHSQGMKKFSEMFPGVMGGDLGFDPMAIAVQMNPENHKRAAMDQINKMLTGNKGHMSNPLANGNVAATNFAQENVVPTNQQNIPLYNQQAMYNQPGSKTTPMDQNPLYGSDMNAATTPAHPNQQQVIYETRAPQQPVYTGAPATNLERVSPLQQYQYQQQQIDDPSTGATIQQTPPVANQEATGDLNAQHQDQRYTSEQALDTQLMVQDPIFPADTSSKPFNPPLNMRRQRFYQYNTLGQPVQMLPAKMFHSSPETNLPQTLYPQAPSGKLRKDMVGHNVKSTLSKTSLMGNKPVGRTPSRSQLQNIYHQYKGSHSSTQQNIRNPAGQSHTNSEGKLGVQRVVTQAHLVPVEKVGGDTAINNQVMHNLAPVKEMSIEQHGDVPAANKPHGDMIPAKEPPKMQGNIGNVRNGLQDMVYTAYPTSAAWSFHGDGGMPYSAGYRSYRGHRGRS